jgi:hypothetical protein
MSTRKCQRCESPRLIGVNGKTSDMCNVINHETGTEIINDYVPPNIGLGRDEDYIEFSYCVQCGQIQDKFPKELPKKLH